MTRRFEGPRPVTKDAAEEIFRRGSSEEIAQTLVDVAFSDLDRSWAQERCFDFLRANDWQLWGVSGICLGHLLRSGFSIDLEAAIPLLDAARRDERVRGQANDALADIRQLHPALSHDREVRERARLAQTLRQWLRREHALTAGDLWSLLPDDAPLAKLLDSIEGRLPSTEERSAIDAEAAALLASVQGSPERPITLFGDELDAFRTLVDEHATASDAATTLEIERWLAVLGCVFPVAATVLEDVNRGGKATPEALAAVLASARDRSP